MNLNANQIIQTNNIMIQEKQPKRYQTNDMCESLQSQFQITVAAPYNQERWIVWTPGITRIIIQDGNNITNEELPSIITLFVHTAFASWDQYVSDYIHLVTVNYILLHNRETETEHIGAQHPEETL